MPLMNQSNYIYDIIYIGWNCDVCFKKSPEEILKIGKCLLSLDNSNVQLLEKHINNKTNNLIYIYKKIVADDILYYSAKLVETI